MVYYEATKINVIVERLWIVNGDIFHQRRYNFFYDTIKYENLYDIKISKLIYLPEIKDKQHKFFYL